MIYILQTTASLGIAGTGLAIAIAIYKTIVKKMNRFKVTVDIENILLQQRTAIDKWTAELEGKMKASNIKIKIKRFILYKLLIMVTTFIVCFLYFKNFTATIFISAAMFFIPDYLVHLIDNRKKAKEEEQLVIAIRIFTSEYMQHYQLEKAFASIYNRVPSPLGTYFGDAYYDLMVAKPVDAVLSTLSAKIDNYYGKMFVHLMIQIKKDSTVINLLSDLLVKLEESIGLSQTNKTSLSGERVLAFIMAISPIPIYLFMRVVVPEIEYFVINTMLGRLLITTTFLSLFLYIVLDRIIGRV